MGIFFNFINNDKSILSLNEFEVDGKKSEETEDYSVDGADNDNTPEAKPNDGNTQNNNDQPKIDDDGAKEEDYDINEDEDDDGEETEEEEENNNDTEDEEDDGVKEDDYTIDEDDGEETEEYDTSSDNSNDEEARNEYSRLKELEGELFDTLTPDQKQIKIDELKKCYQELHSRCDNIIKMINDADTPDENASRIFEYLNDSLSNLKQYVYDYFTYAFDTKSYLENDAQYQKYIAILNSFNGILEQLLKNKESEEK